MHLWKDCSNNMLRRYFQRDQSWIHGFMDHWISKKQKQQITGVWWRLDVVGKTKVMLNFIPQKSKGIPRSKYDLSKSTTTVNPGCRRETAPCQTHSDRYRHRPVWPWRPHVCVALELSGLTGHQQGEIRCESNREREGGGAKPFLSFHNTECYVTLKHIHTNLHDCLPSNLYLQFLYVCM